MQYFRTYLYLSQLALFTCLVLCALIVPRIIFENKGVSNFGNGPATLGFYSLGFILNSFFLYKASQHIPHMPRLSGALVGLSILTFIVFLSTFTRHINLALSDTHVVLGSILYAYYFALAAWATHTRPSVLNISLLALGIAGSLIALLSLARIIHILFIGQMLGWAGFAILLCLALPRIVEANT